jgi:hypothetical protein
MFAFVDSFFERGFLICIVFYAIYLSLKYNFKNLNAMDRKRKKFSFLMRKLGTNSIQPILK